MKLFKRLSLMLLALLMLAMVSLYLIPLDVYLPEVEQMLSSRLHTPVSIQHLRLVAVPLPHLDLIGVRLGGADGIAVESVSVDFDFPSLLGGEKVMRRIVVKEGVVTPGQLNNMLVLFNKSTEIMQNTQVRSVSLSGMTLVLPAMRIGPVEGRLDMGPTGKLVRAVFALDDQRGAMTLVPLPNDHFAVQMKVQNMIPAEISQGASDELRVEGVLGKSEFVAHFFSVVMGELHITGSGAVEFVDQGRVYALVDQLEIPFAQVMGRLDNAIEADGKVRVHGVASSKGHTLDDLKRNFIFSGDVNLGQLQLSKAGAPQPPLLVDELVSHVLLDDAQIESSGLAAKLYGGQIAGSAVWRRDDAELTAEFVASQIDMKLPVQALTGRFMLSGQMEGGVKLVTRWDGADGFLNGLRLEGNYHLRQGELARLDLLHAASLSGKVPESQSGTHFDDLTGLLVVDANGYHLKSIKIESGVLQAAGDVDIDRSLRLSGKLDVDVRGTLGLVSVPVKVSGTLYHPEITPSRSALAGAAVGTALLGPGLGTALGLKIGGFLNHLLGMGNTKKENE